MRPILTPEQMRELDRRTIEEAGLPGIVLMELAARGVMLEVDTLLGGRVPGARALVFCGGGNNGGDGFAVARRLLNFGAEVTVYLVAERSKISGDALTNLKVYENLGGKVIEVKSRKDLEKIPPADVIVDALLGTGLRGGADGLIADAIEAINISQASVVSVDIPSGVDGSTGHVAGVAVRADLTATFGEIKVGHIVSPGIDHAGRISRVDIQIPPKYVMEIEVPMYLVEPADVCDMLPDRRLTQHKGDNGKVLVVAGSVGMTGAAELAAKAILRTGAGMVKVATAKSAQAILAGRSAEVMTIPVADTETGSIAAEAETTIDEARKWADVEVIGPGLSLNPETIKWFEGHVDDLPLPTVIDADGLNALAQLPGALKGLAGKNVVLTPHLGEFARLAGKPSADIAADRLNSLRQFAEQANVTVVLKGVPTLIAGPSGPVYAVLAGNPGMATAGMGDVLTGVIAGFLAQGLNPQEASIAAVTVHGLAGNLAADEVGSTGIVAGDVVEKLPLAQDIVAGRASYPQSKGQGDCSCGENGGDCNCDDEGGSCNCGHHHN
ncbi:MAG: NAD(P)H-hydrate dehydratase [bacterium]